MEKIYSTSNVALSAYLLLQGIEFKEIKRTDKKDILEFVFKDEKQNCRDLERVFLNSEFKKYYEFNKYLLRELHLKSKELNKST